MNNNRRKDSWDETIKNAASGYGAVVLSVICFMLSLAVITFVVRLIVGASTGSSV